jgi:hypothetical protein
MESNEKKPIKRMPIILGKNTVALLHIFEKYDDLEDMWMSEFGQYVEENFEEHEEAAKQFIAQLKDNWCVLFMVHLIKEGFRTMVDEDRSAFTKKYAAKLIEELKEINESR